MSSITRIKGADFSASGLPKLNKQVLGFDAADLAALYLCQDGAVGAFAGPVIDRMGVRHAPLRTGSVVTRVAEGLHTPDNGVGFTFDTGVPYGNGGSFCAFGVARVTDPVISSAQYPSLHGATVGLQPSQASSHTMLRGIHFNSYRVDTIAQLSPGLFLGTGFAGAAATQRTTSILSGGTPVDWFAWAWSWDHAAKLGTFRVAANGRATTTFGGGVTQDSLQAAMAAADLGNHYFGLSTYSNLTGGGGDVAVAGLYTVAKTVAEMDAINVKTKALVASRGITPF